MLFEWLPDFIKTGRFILSSGADTNYYIDIKNATMYPGILNDIIQHITQVMGYHQFNKVVGIEFGSAPIAIGYSLWTGLECAIVRKEPKKYGTMDGVIGNLQKGDRVLLIDDVLSTGHSLRKAEEKIFENGAKVIEKIVVFDRQEEDKPSYTPYLACYEDVKFVIQHMIDNPIEDFKNFVGDESE